MGRLRRGRFIFTSGLAAAAALTLGVYIYLNRVELILLPITWREVQRELERLESSGESLFSRELNRALVRLLELQMAEVPTWEDLSLTRIRTTEGSEAYLIEFQQENRNCYHVLSSRGHLLPIGLKVEIISESSQVSNQGTDERGPDTLYLWMDAIEGFNILEFAADEEGIFPRGFTLENLEQGRIFLPAKYCEPASKRIELSGLQAPDVSRIRLLLASPRPGDLFRALFSMEQRGKEDAYLALPVLRHPREDLRARAALVVGRNPSLARKLLPLLEDPLSEVRDAAAQALLDAGDVHLARRGLLHLLRNRRRPVLENMPIDLRRLRSPGVVGAILDWMEDDPGFQFIRDPNHPDRQCWLDLELLEREDLDPLIPRLILLWKNLPKQDGMFPREIIRWLVQVDDPRTDGVLVDALSEWHENPLHPKSAPSIAFQILSGLHGREIPLRGARGRRILREIAGNLWPRCEFIPEDLPALLLLARYGEPGARERFEDEMRESSSLWLPALVSGIFEEPGDYSEFLGKGTDSWLNHVPPACLAALLRHLCRESRPDVPYTLAFLSALRTPSLRELTPEIVCLWRRLEELDEVDEEFVTLAERVNSPVLDQAIARTIATFSLKEKCCCCRLEEMLLALLEWKERGMEDTGAIRELWRVAGLPPDRSPELTERRLNREVPEKTRHVSTQDQPFVFWPPFSGKYIMEPALCVSFLLVGWNAEGAREHLESRLLREGNTWIHDELLDRYAPVGWLPRLEVLASRLTPGAAARALQIIELNEGD